MARERYLLHGDEEPIRKAVSELPPLTEKDKRKNFWHYHKLYFILGGCLVIFFVALIWTISSQKDPDYSIAIVGKYNVSEEALDIMEETLTPYAEDVNGDGEVILQISNYAITYGDVGDVEVEDKTFQEAYRMRFQLDLQEGESVILLMDDENYAHYSGQDQQLFCKLDGEPIDPNEEVGLDEIRISPVDCTAIGDTEIAKAFKDYKFCLRDFPSIYQGENANEEKIEEFNNSMELFQKIAYGEPLESDTASGTVSLEADSE